ncbi:hypothetical protein TCAL_09615 [Tigriopus californicus]|uniref:Peptidase S1 domain-containing protein n=1 Tax=Tigriopus californicus TaxID=6832 RepID=A0A553NVS0_TIGCA|nr:hypothetical protein TCAL_09615 [Tigriopus californicus]
MGLVITTRKHTATMLHSPLPPLGALFLILSLTTSISLAKPYHNQGEDSLHSSERMINSYHRQQQPQHHSWQQQQHRGTHQADRVGLERQIQPLSCQSEKTGEKGVCIVMSSTGGATPTTMDDISTDDISTLTSETSTVADDSSFEEIQDDDEGGDFANTTTKVVPDEEVSTEVPDLLDELAVKTTGEEFSETTSQVSQTTDFPDPEQNAVVPLQDKISAPAEPASVVGTPIVPQEEPESPSAPVTTMSTGVASSTTSALEESAEDGDETLINKDTTSAITLEFDTGELEAGFTTLGTSEEAAASSEDSIPNSLLDDLDQSSNIETTEATTNTLSWISEDDTTIPTVNQTATSTEIEISTMLTKNTTDTILATTVTTSDANVDASVTVACGRRPWFKVPNRESLYSDGVRNGPSEARIGQAKMGDDELKLFFNREERSVMRSGRIVNGLAADYGEWPWQVSLRQWRTATYLHKCGCALLSENWAITAAHCVENVSPDDLSLRMGEYDLNGVSEPHKFVDRTVQIVASHPKFDPKTFEYDLALLRFYEPVTFSPNIIPICIPEDDKSLVGETAWVTGWGRLYEDGPLPSVMQEVGLPVIKNSDCELMYKDAGYVEHIPNIFICAGYEEGGKDSCEGDSGGPMVVQKEDGRFMLSGVISWGIGCAEKNQPGVYTRISHFKDWINQILQF